MAQKRPVTGYQEPQPQEEMTVVVFKFKGGAESMQKGFDAVNNAIAALSPAPANNHRVVVQRTPAAIAAPQNGDVLDSQVEGLGEEGGQIEEDVAAPAEAPGPAGKPKKTWEPKKYAFLSDFSLAPAGQPPLKEFCNPKNPQTKNDKYLVVSLWIMKHGGVDSFTDNHIFTAFAGWSGRRRSTSRNQCAR